MSLNKPPMIAMHLQVQEAAGDGGSHTRCPGTPRAVETQEADPPGAEAGGAGSKDVRLP